MTTLEEFMDRDDLVPTVETPVVKPTLQEFIMTLGCWFLRSCGLKIMPLILTSQRSNSVIVLIVIRSVSPVFSLSFLQGFWIPCMLKYDNFN